MPPTCFICEERKIDFSNKCTTCKKCVCYVCYNRMSKFETTGENVRSIYSCPFCTNKKTEEITDISSDVKTEMIIDNVINLNHLFIERKKLQEKNEYLQYQILKIKNKEKEMSISFLEDLCNMVEKKNRKTIKIVEIRESIEEIRKND